MLAESSGYIGEQVRLAEQLPLAHSQKRGKKQKETRHR
jgi:hypothetical protein